MKHLARAVFAVVAFGMAVTMVACSYSGLERSLSGDLKKFIDYKTSQDYGGVWASSSPRFRESNDNDSVEFERYARSYGVYASKIEVLEIVEANSEAKVVVRTHYVENNGAHAGSAVEEWKFVSVRGNWFYDGSRTISESAD